MRAPLTALDLAIDFSLLDCWPSFYFSFWFSEDRLGFPMLERRYHHFVVLLDSERYSMSPAVTMWKRNNALEHRDNPGTTTRRKVSVLHRFSHSLSDVAFDHWPTRKYNNVLRQSLPDDKTASVSSSSCTVTKNSRSWTYTLCFLTYLHFSIGCNHRWWFLDFRMVPSSAELKFILLSMRTDALESTTNSRSSGLLKEGAGIAHASVGQ